MQGMPVRAFQFGNKDARGGAPAQVLATELNQVVTRPMGYPEGSSQGCGCGSAVPFRNEKIPARSLLFLGLSGPKVTKPRWFMDFRRKGRESLLNPWLGRKFADFGQNPIDQTAFRKNSLLNSLVQGIATLLRLACSRTKRKAVFRNLHPRCIRYLWKPGPVVYGCDHGKTHHHQHKAERPVLNGGWVSPHIQVFVFDYCLRHRPVNAGLFCNVRRVRHWAPLPLALLTIFYSRTNICDEDWLASL